MKEAPKNYPGLIFQELFIDEQHTRKNGGVPTDVSYSNGVGEFNGSSSQIDYASKRNLEWDNGSAFSVRAIVTINSIGNYLEIMNKATAGSGNTVSYRLSINNSGYAFFGTSTGSSSSIIISTILLIVGETYELIGVADGSDICIYVNTISSTTTSQLGPYKNGGILTIGRWGVDGGVYYPFDGNIDLVEIYNRALTPSEVSNMYNSNWNLEQSTLKGADILEGWMFGPPDAWTPVGGTSITGANTFSNNGSLGGIYRDFSLIEGERYDCRIIGTTDISDLILRGGISTTAYSPNLTGSFDEIFSFIADGSGDLYLFSEAPSGSGTATVTTFTLFKRTNKTLLDFDSTNGVLEDKMVGSVDGDLIINEVDRDFTGAGNWAAAGSATINIVNEKLVVVTTGISDYTYLHGTYVNNMISGHPYRYIFDLTDVTGGTVKIQLDGGLDIATGLTNGIGQVLLHIGTSGISLNGEFRFVAETGTTGFTISNVRLQQLRPDLLATDIDIKKIGNAYGALFNGSTSKIDTGTDMIGTKAITAMVWVNLKSSGEVNAAKIFNNGKTELKLFDTTKTIIFSGSLANANSAANAYMFGKQLFIAITCNASGVANIYTASLEASPLLSGSADQDSGARTAGTTNLIIGNDNAGSRTMDGYMPKLKVVEGILSLAEITQYWSETLKELK